MAGPSLQELFPRSASPVLSLSCVCVLAWAVTYPAQLMHSSTVVYEHAGVYFGVTLVQIVVLAALFGVSRVPAPPKVAAACGLLAAVVGVGATFGLFTWKAAALLAALLVAQLAAFVVVFGAVRSVEHWGVLRGMALAACGLLLAFAVHFGIDAPLSNVVGAPGNFGVYSQVAAVTSWLLVAVAGVALAVPRAASDACGQADLPAGEDASQASEAEEDALAQAGASQAARIIANGSPSATDPDTPWADSPGDADDAGAGAKEVAGFPKGPQVTLLMALIVVVCVMACVVCTLGGFLATPYYLEPFALADGVSLGLGLVGAALLAAVRLLPTRDMQLLGLAAGLAMLLSLVGVILCIIARNVQMMPSVLLYTSFGAFAAVLLAIALFAWSPMRVRAGMVMVAVQLFALFCSQFGGLAVKQAIGVDAESIALVVFVMVAVLLVVFLGVSLVLNVLSQRALVQASHDMARASQDMAQAKRALREIESMASSIEHASEVIDDKNRKFLDQFDMTERQRDYALLLLRGLTYDQIAEAEGVQVTTVRYHASNIYKKADVASKAEFRELADEWNAQN